jgi:MFS family permease
MNTPEQNRSPHTSSAWSVALMATLGMSVCFVDRQTMAAIAPSVTKALAIDNTHYGWLLGAFSMAYLAFAPLAGVVIDRVGARRAFAAAVLVWSVVAGAHAVATSFASLLVLRILLGTAEAPAFPSAVQAIRRAVPGARRALAVGLLFSGSSLGTIVAAKLAVPLDAAYGFRAAFVGTALLGSSWIPIWLWVTRGHGLDRAATSPSASEIPRGGREAWIGLVIHPPVFRAIVAVAGAAPALLFCLSWTSKYLVDGFGVPTQNVGNYLIAAPFLFDLGAIGLGLIASARDAATAARGLSTVRTHKDLLLVSMLLTASLAMAPLAHSPVIAAALVATSACGEGGLFALVTADMLARVPVERASAAGGIIAAAQSLTYVIAGPLIGWTIDRTHGYDGALVAVGLIVIPTSIAFLAWPGIPAEVGASQAPPPSRRS